MIYSQIDMKLNLWCFFLVIEILHNMTYLFLEIWKQNYYLFQSNYLQYSWRQKYGPTFLFWVAFHNSMGVFQIFLFYLIEHLEYYKYVLIWHVYLFDIENKKQNKLRDYSKNFIKKDKMILLLQNTPTDSQS